MCKWCARQCRPVRHHSSVRAQLRPRSPHFRRQNPYPRHRTHAARVQGTCARLRAGGRVGARGRACTCKRQRQTCVCIWALGSRGALGPRTCLSRFSFHCAAVHTRCETQGARLGDNQGRSYSRKGLARALRTVPSAHRRLSAVTLFVNLPMAPDSRTIICGRAPHEPGSVYNRPETPSMPGLLRLFRAACDSTSSIDVTRSVRVSMYRARAC